MNESKKREILGILFGMAAFVGLVKKMGIGIPLLTPLVSAVFNAAFFRLSEALQTYTPFVAHLRAIKEPILWSLSSAWLGVGLWLWSSRHEESEKIRKIPLTYYPLMVPVISAAAFALGYAWDPGFRVQFYSSAFSLNLIFGFLVGKFWCLGRVV